MNDQRQSFLNRLDNPIYQALSIMLLGILIVATAKLLDIVGVVDLAPRFPWLISASFLLLYALLNSIFGLQVKETNQYWQYSIYSFIGFLFASAGVAYLFSGIAIGDAASYKWIYFVLTIIYLVFISIVRLMRFIVYLAQKQDKNLHNEHD
jgi:hypothetical protein